MVTAVPQSSGHTVFASHIEAPAKPFLVAFNSPAYVNVLHFAPTRRRVRVLAETPNGALCIARYHYSRGAGFALKAPKNTGDRHHQLMRQRAVCERRDSVPVSQTSSEPARQDRPTLVCSTASPEPPPNPRRQPTWRSPC